MSLSDNEKHDEKIMPRKSLRRNLYK